MADTQTIEVPIQGMDCADCTVHVRNAIAGLPGVEAVDVFLGAEKAIVRIDAGQVGLENIRSAVAQAGYSVPEDTGSGIETGSPAFVRGALALFGLVFGAVLFVVVAGEMLGLFEALTQRVPLPVGTVLVLLAGYPVFRNVIRAAIQRQVISHTLMTLGVLAALAVGEWATAAVVVFFMRVGDYAERFTTERARRAVKDLSALAPQKARILEDGEEVEIPIEAIRVGQTVVIRPGEKVPVDGEVIAGQATVNQATITGEAMPVEAGPGSHVFAATFVTLGSLRVRVTHVGPDTTFGRVIKLVEEAEAHRGPVQRVADRFSAYYLPVVGGIALLTFLIGRNPLAAAAVLVVACSCSIALATPIAILASVGAGARRGLVIKGGKYLETLAKVDVLLIDKTGTLTLGQPRISGFELSPSFSNGAGPGTEDRKLHILALAASAERYSEHPLSEAVRRAAIENGVQLSEPHDFEALPGLGVRASVNGSRVAVGNRRLMETTTGAALHGELATLKEIESGGNSVLFVAIDGKVAGAFTAADTLRPEVPQALAGLRRIGIQKVEVLTGDNPQSAAALADQIGAHSRAGLLPEDKIAIVKAYQQDGHVVAMIGDGVNDAPALAQADVGIAMGAAGAQIAMEAAHIILLREDWSLVPELFRISRRTMNVIKMNLGFTAVYNLVGISLAALGFLPPIFAAAAQSLPDLGILANSSRLLRQR